MQLLCPVLALSIESFLQNANRWAYSRIFFFFYFRNFWFHTNVYVIKIALKTGLCERKLENAKENTDPFAICAKEIFRLAGAQMSIDYQIKFPNNIAAKHNVQVLCFFFVWVLFYYEASNFISSMNTSNETISASSL